MRRTRLAGLFFIVAGAATQLFADLPPLIPRNVLFGNPERTAPQLSPDGKRLAWLAPEKKGTPLGRGERAGAGTTTNSPPPIRSAAFATTPGRATTRHCSTCRTTTATRTFISTAST